MRREYLGQAILGSRSLAAALVLAGDATGGPVAVDLESAKGMPGVVAAFSAADLPEVLMGTAAAPPDRRLDAAADTPLLAATPRYYGDAVAVIVAGTEHEARRAAASARVNAVGARGEPVSRSVCRAQVGDLDEIGVRIDACSMRVDLTVETQAVSHVCLESHACLAIPHGSGWLEVWSNTQAPSELRRILCEALGLSMNRVRVRKYLEGGGFGAKQEVYEEPLVAWLALTLGEAVHLRYSRTEDLARSRTRHASKLSGSAGITEKGRLVGLTLSGRVFGGAYLSHTPYVVGDLVSAPSYTYGDVYAGKCTGTVDWGRTPAGAYRGYGAPQATFLVEQLVDEAARQHGIDPLSFRETQLGEGLGRPDLFPAASSDRLIELIRKTRVEAGWDDWPGGGASLGGRLFGKGASVATMLNALGFDRMEEALAVVRVNADGTIQVVSPATDCGTGSSGAFSALVAEVFEMQPDAVEAFDGDTDGSIADVGSYAQRSLYVGGGAVLVAARDARALLESAAAAQHGIDATDVAITTGGHVQCGAERVPIHVVARRAVGDGRPIVGFGRYTPGGQSATYGVWLIQVSVAPGSGALSVDRLVVGVDCGIAVVPGSVRGQVVGGAVQGLSNALYEVGHVPGRPPPSTIRAHGMIRPQSVPVVEVVTLDKPAERGPAGAKGVGEIGIVGVPAAISNAVRDGVGWRPLRLPITTQDVWQGLQS